MASPLVTVTLTTEQMAQISAGLIQLRRFWSVRSHSFSIRSPEYTEALDMIKDISLTIQHLNSLVTPEQGADLIRELMNKHR